MFAQVMLRAMYVGSIVIARGNVFAPGDSGVTAFIGSLANSIHWRTRESVIRDELLFREGDTYDPGLAYESERNIRALGIVGDVSLTCDTVSADTVRITVRTTDRWTLGLNTGYGQGGGITTFFASLKDDNFLGNNQKISAGYDYSTDRPHPSGYSFAFEEPRTLGSRWRTRFQGQNSDDERLVSLFLEHPYYAESARSAGGLYIDNERSRVREFSGGTTVLDDQISSQNFIGWGSGSWGDRQKIRLSSAYFRRRTDAGPVPARVFDNLDLLTLSGTLVEREYYRGRYIDNFGRVEDIPLGYQFSVTGGKGIRFSSAAAADYYIRASADHAWGIDQRYYCNYGADLSSFVSGGELVESVATASVIQHFTVIPRYTMAMRLLGVVGHNLSPTSQIVLGTQSGLRGYAAHEFSGTREILLNLEHRFYPDLMVWSFRFGGTLFFDSGTVWDRQDPASSLKGHSSAGFGIRIENTKAEGNGIIRIDFAFNLDARRFAQIIVSSNQLFGGSSDITFTPPTPFYPN